MAEDGVVVRSIHIETSAREMLRVDQANEVEVKTFMQNQLILMDLGKNSYKPNSIELVS